MPKENPNSDNNLLNEIKNIQKEGSPEKLLECGNE